MAKKQYRPKVQYIDKPEYYEFKNHQMIKIPIKINPVTGYGEAISMGVSKAEGVTNVKNLIALKQFVKDNLGELKVIADDAHLKQEQDE